MEQLKRVTNDMFLAGRLMSLLWESSFKELVAGSSYYA